MGIGRVGVVVKRFDVYLVNLDPTIGSEIKKTRPCVVVSPDELNRHIATVIVAPLTSQGKAYPTRIDCSFQGKEGRVVLDQMRTVDKTHLVKRLGALSSKERDEVLRVLSELFAP
jgi:mRNA interferase MazF